MALDHEHFMGIALDLARKAAAEGNRPVGSIIVDPRGTIVGQGTNRVFTDFDPTAHGETLAIRDACGRLQALDLSACTLYSSLEPCPMCCWAIIDAKIGTLVLGGRHAALGRTDVGRYSVESFLEFTGRSLQLVTGVRANESEDMRRAWNAERAARSGRS